MNEQRHSFLKNSFITLTRQFFSVVIGVLLVVFLARFLGPEARGEYALITFFPLLLITFLNFGFNVATIFYVSKKEVSIQTAIVTNIFVALFLGIISIVVGYIFIHLFDTQYGYLNKYYLYCGLLSLPFMFLFMFLQTVFQGLQNFKMFNSVLLVQQLATLLLVVLFTILFRLKLFGAILAFSLGYVVTVVFIFFIVYRVYRITLRFSDFSFPYVKKMFNYGVKAYISNALTFLNYRLDIFLLGHFVNPLAVGIYDVAVSVGERISIFSQSISSVLFPKISSVQSEEQRNKITSTVSRNLLFFIASLSLILYFLCDFIFNVFFGEQYVESARLLKILLPGLALLSVEKVLSNDLAGRGKPEVNMYVAFFNVCLNACLNIYMIPHYGAMGAAISSTITYATSFMVKVVLYRKYTRQNYVSFLVIGKEDMNIYRNLLRKAISK